MLELRGRLAHSSNRDMISLSTLEWSFFYDVDILTLGYGNGTL
jgi:hypothetical protein